ALTHDSDALTHDCAVANHHKDDKSTAQSWVSERNHGEVSPNDREVGPNYREVGPNHGEVGPNQGEDIPGYRQAAPIIDEPPLGVHATIQIKVNQSCQGRGIGRIAYG